MFLKHKSPTGAIPSQGNLLWVFVARMAIAAALVAVAVSFAVVGTIPVAASPTGSHDGNIQGGGEGKGEGSGEDKDEGKGNGGGKGQDEGGGGKRPSSVLDRMFASRAWEGAPDASWLSNVMKAPDREVARLVQEGDWHRLQRLMEVATVESVEVFEVVRHSNNKTKKTSPPSLHVLEVIRVELFDQTNIIAITNQLDEERRHQFLEGLLETQVQFINFAPPKILHKALTYPRTGRGHNGFVQSVFGNQRLWEAMYGRLLELPALHDDLVFAALFLHDVALGSVAANLFQRALSHPQVSEGTLVKLIEYYLRYYGLSLYSGDLVSIAYRTGLLDPKRDKHTLDLYGHLLEESLPQVSFSARTQVALAFAKYYYGSGFTWISGYNPSGRELFFKLIEDGPLEVRMSLLESMIRVQRMIQKINPHHKRLLGEIANLIRQLGQVALEQMDFQFLISYFERLSSLSLDELYNPFQLKLMLNMLRSYGKQLEEQMRFRLVSKLAEKDLKLLQQLLFVVEQELHRRSVLPNSVGLKTSGGSGEKKGGNGTGKGDGGGAFSCGGTFMGDSIYGK
ncbi:MAG: hypothetical protein NZ480_05000 [Bdellovibrionaceae bacterium]|nr:hypothetical protein [Pseudobdellovibrionaceae bacterium]